MALHEIAAMVDDFKEKLTTKEYKNIMDKLKSSFENIDNTDTYEIEYIKLKKNIIIDENGTKLYNYIPRRYNRKMKIKNHSRQTDIDQLKRNIKENPSSYEYIIHYINGCKTLVIHDSEEIQSDSIYFDQLSSDYVDSDYHNEDNTIAVYIPNMILLDITKI